VRDATTDEAQIQRWSRQWPKANWAAAADGYTVLDADSADAHLAFSDAHEPAGLIVGTGGGGGHHWFRGEHGKSCAKVLGSALDYDVRAGAGAYVLLPGSRHVNGRVYRVERGDPAGIGAAPEWAVWLAEGISRGGRAQSMKRFRQHLNAAPSGEHSGRNNWVAITCGFLARLLRGHRWLYDAAVRGAVADIADQTGFPETEWLGIAERIWSSDEDQVAQNGERASSRPKRGSTSPSTSG
jgi:hypothetical protein